MTHLYESMEWRATASGRTILRARSVRPEAKTAASTLDEIEAALGKVG